MHKSAKVGALTAAAALVLLNAQPVHARQSSKHGNAELYEKSEMVRCFQKMGKQKKLLEPKGVQVAFGPYIIFFG